MENYEKSQLNQSNNETRTSENSPRESLVEQEGGFFSD